MSIVAMAENLALRTARSHVINFVGELEQLEMLTQRGQLTDGVDAGSYLQLGIEAFNWIGRADTEIRLAIFNGRLEYSEHWDLSVEALYRTWLKPCAFAQRWIAAPRNQGVEVGNVAEFLKCVAETEAIVRALDGSQPMNEAMIQLRDEAIEEHRVLSTEY